VTTLCQQGQEARLRKQLFEAPIDHPEKPEREVLSEKLPNATNVKSSFSVDEKLGSFFAHYSLLSSD